MGFIRIVLTEYGSYFFVVYLSFLFGISLFNITLNANLIILCILFAAEGIILNQIIRISGLPSQLVLRGSELSVIWKYTNPLILLALNATYLITAIYVEIQNGFWYGLLELNYFLIPALAIGNKISNTKIAYYYTFFKIPVLRYILFMVLFSLLFILNIIIDSYLYELLVIVISLSILIIYCTKKSYIQNTSIVYEIDKYNYD